MVSRFWMAAAAAVGAAIILTREKPAAPILAKPTSDQPAQRAPCFIGSLTKSITALAVMQLVEAGKVELDAPVQRYLPWFRVADASHRACIGA
jgi:hypothetical protein